MKLQLKQILQEISQTQSDLARHLKCSSATVAQICNYGIFPKKPDGKTVRSGILKFLAAHGASDQSCRRAFDAAPQIPPSPPLTKGGAQRAGDFQPQEEIMLLRKQTLTPAARKHFELFRDPFADDLQTHEDVFLSDDMRYVRETLWHTAKHGGFVAVVGESGAGKSTLRRDLKARIARENQDVVVIEPFVQGMEEDDIKGKTLKSSHIAEIIMMAVAPLEKIKRSPQARLDQVRNMLLCGVSSKTSYVLIIEEAHCLPTATLKHLKRFFELEADDGFRKLLGIVLLGQQELSDKLSGKYREVREVAQRCQVIKLPPLDSQLEDYLKFKFERTGKKLSDVAEPSAIEAMRDRLSVVTKDQRGNPVVKISLLYPLAVANLLIASMNLTAAQGFSKVDGDAVREA